LKERLTERRKDLKAEKMSKVDRKEKEITPLMLIISEYFPSFPISHTF
jgi:hypothetical protein